ncbi:MAG: SpoIIE family protein phosphatase [Acidobacteriota bacterium]|nr:SpoIIE family protein phosphatase [Acidobacteriota bacterium]
MPNPDSAATKIAPRMDPVQASAAGVVDLYLRKQLETRREQLKTAIAELPTDRGGADATQLAGMLHEVDSAIQRMNAGTYGICDFCHEDIGEERLIADPLATLCLEHLSGEEQRALERDLELAARIQRGLLPRENLRVGEWHIHFRYRPAGIVSGDYCDVISAPNDDGSTLILVGDVAGKGVAAAMLMSHLHAMFRSLTGMGLDLGRLMEMANRVFCESTFAGQYATLVCARADSDGRVEIANAGHLPALLVSQDSVQKIGSTGLPLGMFSGSRYSIEAAHVEPRESLLLFTDGISEATAAAGGEYGVDGLSSAAGRHRHLQPREMAAACIEDVVAFGGGTRAADDQTLMVVQRAARGA